MKALTIFAVITAVIIASNAGTANAQTVASNTISSTIKNAVSATKENAAKNSALRNQLVTESSNAVFTKEKALVDQLTESLLDLENIQTRIAAKTAETAASGTDTILVSAWLATSSADIILAQNDIAAFASSTPVSSSSPLFPADIAESRKLANAAIADLNTAHDDLQSALDALTNIL